MYVYRYANCLLKRYINKTNLNNNQSAICTKVSLKDTQLLLRVNVFLRCCTSCASNSIFYLSPDKDLFVKLFSCL